MVLKLRKKLQEKRAAANRILSAVAASDETRDMSPEERTQFDGLMRDVEVIKSQIAQLEAIEADEDMDAPAPAESPRSLPERPAGRRSAPVAEAPAVHTERRQYSLLRAIRCAVNGQPLDGLEGELSSEIARRSNKQPKGFFLPLGSDPEIRSLMAGGRKPESRDLTTTTGAGSIFTVAEMPIIDALRAKLVVRRLGATVLTGLQGPIAVPRQTATATVYWLGEGSSATPGSPSIDQVPLTPKVAIALTNISRKFLNQTSMDAEAFVRSDLAATMAREWDRVAINGTGTNQPLGILQNSSITTLSGGIQGGTNGLALTYAQMIGMESLVATSNADTNSLAYLTNPTQRGKLKSLPEIGTTFPTFVYQKGGEIGVGEINGYPAYVTTAVPNNLTKGTGTNLSAVIFGNWSDLVVGSWDDAVDFLVNPYSNQASGAVVISLEMSMDVAAKHNESFSVVSDAV